jgi:hypothetical protein
MTTKVSEADVGDVSVCCERGAEPWRTVTFDHFGPLLLCRLMLRML